MNVHVHTADGVATICGDVIYDFNDQIVTPFNEIHDMEPRTTGNHGVSKRAEKASIKKLLSQSRYLLPVHDRPAKIEGGVVVGRLAGLRARPAHAIAAEAQLVSRLIGARRHDAYGSAIRVRGAGRRLRAGRPGRHGIHVHRGADLASGRASSDCSPTCPPTCAGAGTRAAASRRSGGRRTNATA